MYPAVWHHEVFHRLGEGLVDGLVLCHFDRGGLVVLIELEEASRADTGSRSDTGDLRSQEVSLLAWKWGITRNRCVQIAREVTLDLRWRSMYNR